MLRSIIILAFLLASGPTNRLFPQERSGDVDLQQPASLSLLREDGRIDEDRFRPGLTLLGRIHFLRFLHAELAFSYAMTHREDEYACLEGFDCSALNRAWGSLHIFSGSIGASIPDDTWRPFFGFGRGHTWDSPLRIAPSGMVQTGSGISA